MHRILLVSLAVLLPIPVSAQASYDVVINNGRVMDPETLYDGIANVGIKDGRIAVITKNSISGRKTIEAAGHIVAPGFIDTHFHWQAPLGYKIGLRDGLTTSMVSVSTMCDVESRFSFQIGRGTGLFDPRLSCSDGVVERAA